jgi:hypothetical protein
MEEHQPESGNDRSHWVTWYIWVGMLLVLEIVFFTIFTRYFS